MGWQTVGHDWATFTSLSKYRTEAFFTIENWSGGVEGRHKRERMCIYLELIQGFPGGSVVKNPAANAGDLHSIRGSSIEIHREGNDNPLQYSALGNPRKRSLAGYSPWGHRVRQDWSMEHTCIADSSCYTVEINTTLYSNYTPIKGGEG